MEINVGMEMRDDNRQCAKTIIIRIDLAKEDWMVIDVDFQDRWEEYVRKLAQEQIDATKEMY